MASLLAAHSSVSCVAADEWETLVALVGARPFIGLSAMSTMDQPGEAGRAIALFRANYGDTEVALYNAWDYNVRRAAMRALEYDADGIIMPGIDTAELLDCFILRPLTPRSPFWRMQDRVVSPYF